VSRSRFPLLLLAVLLVVAAAWMILAANTYRLGFPLDDAWIHQTFARNLAQRGEWAFLPGQPSAGSTGPLWGALLAVGYLLRLPSVIWSAVLGLLTLWGMAVLTWRIWPLLAPEKATWRILVALTLALEWHLLWAALSGMETLLFAALCLLVLLSLRSVRVAWLQLGGLIGLACWVRPDGLTLLGPALLVAAFKEPRGLLRLLGGFALLFLPYLAFNAWLDGHLWPNTFYAKQAEYAVLREIPFGWRLLREYVPLLAGGGLLIAPGLLLGLKQTNVAKSATILWALAYPALYAWRLPVTYQHGRYVIPVLPIWIVFGWLGMVKVIRGNDPFLIRRVASRVWLLSLIVVEVLFLGLGAQAYTRDVALIESEMVDTARWIAAHTPPGAIVAAHDIGALGYFGQRDVLDLAGLVSPEVVSFIRDETKLAAYLDQQGADYLMTFPGWYPALVRGKPVEYRSPGRFSPLMGGENMAVYRWSVGTLSDGEK